MNGDQGSAGRDIESGGKLQKVLTIAVAPAHEKWNEQRESSPLTSLWVQFLTRQRRAPSMAPHRTLAAKHLPVKH
jgi:hypothetical protein